MGRPQSMPSRWFRLSGGWVKHIYLIQPGEADTIRVWKWTAGTDTWFPSSSTRHPISARIPMEAQLKIDSVCTWSACRRGGIMGAASGYQIDANCGRQRCRVNTAVICRVTFLIWYLIKMPLEETLATFTHSIRQADKLNLAYFCLFWYSEYSDVTSLISSGQIDAMVFGRPCICQPDVGQRIMHGVPLASEIDYAHIYPRFDESALVLYWLMVDKLEAIKIG